MSDLHVVGVQAGRRVRLFTQAATRAGLTVEVLDWNTLLDHVEARTWPRWPVGARVRIDSSGEDQRAEERLRALGGWHRPLAFGEIGGWAQWVAGLTSAVDHLSAAGRGWRLETSSTDLAAQFDKRLTRTRLQSAGIPVPSAGPDVEQLWDTPGRWFVKTAHGSSASGVLAVVVGSGRIDAWAPAQLVDRVPFNDLTVRRLDDAQARDLVAVLAERGPVFTERWFPKASVAGHTVDLRIVVVDGKARTAVVRGSRSPMTNLHLGNTRMSQEAAQAAAGPLWAQMVQLAQAAAGCFPDTRCMGVDVLPGVGWRRAVVGEVNAFGDLLPGVLNEGLDSYDWQVRSVLRDGIGR